MNIIVAGAGTAGWLAALHAKKFNPNANVTVIHDDKTPIIGVGESTVPNFMDMMRLFDISVEELIQNCDATIKNAIRFTNWKGDNTYYHHDFTGSKIQEYFDALSYDINLDWVSLGSTLSRNNKIPVALDETKDRGIYCGTDYALHFDAKKMAEHLRSVGISRGIKTIIGKIEDASLDTDGYVTDIILDTKQRIKTDFIFDCTGFARFFVNKVYNSPLKSYQEILPTKRAMPFFVDNTETIPPFTEAIAMKYGWLWKIPVGKRYGCGYVFDSDYISDKEAYEEICEVIKQKPDVNRVISFKPEYNTKPFNKNTLALGLAHGFLEPLEATSLMITIHMLNILEETLYKNFNRVYINRITESYNRIIKNYVENCVFMVYIHYLNPRNDTKFWENFKNTIPSCVSNKLEQIKNFNIKNRCDILYSTPFNAMNFLKCMGGVNYIDKDTIKRNARLDSYCEIKENIKVLEDISKNSKSHDDYIREMTNI